MDDKLMKVYWKLSEALCEQIDDGVDKVNINSAMACVDMIKDLSMAVYYETVTEAMGSKAYTMTPEMYYAKTAKELRDIDRKSGIMYYPENSAFETAKNKFIENRTLENLGEIYDVFWNEIFKKPLPPLSNSEKTFIKQKMLNGVNEVK